MARFSKLWWAAVLKVTAVLAFSMPTLAQSPSAVVLMYHRFGEAKYPATNTTLTQLEAHIAYLKANNFQVLPLADVVAALKSGTPLPPKAIAITIDDAYKSVVTAAWPKFQQAGFPFTVFVATEAVDQNYRDIMSWDDLRKLVKSGVAIGGHGHAHPHLPALSLEAVRADLETMKARFQAELGAAPTLFAHPYGEAGREDLEMIRKAGFTAAFGQNSGPVYPEADLYLLPRFALNERYGVMDRFALVTNTKPLRAINLKPSDPVLRVNPPLLEFTVHEPPGALSALSCFGPAGARLNVTVDQTQVKVLPGAAFPLGRARVNCTMNVKNQWYWFGQEFLAGGISEGVMVHSRYKN